MRLAEFKVMGYVSYISFNPKPDFFIKSNKVEINEVIPLFLFTYVLEALRLDVMGYFPYGHGFSVSDRIGSKRRVLGMVCFEMGRCTMTAMTERENIEIDTLFDRMQFSLSMERDANNGVIWMVGTVPALL